MKGELNMLSNKTYDILVKIQRWLPALGAFYIGLAKVWSLPLGNEVNATVGLIATLLAATIEVSISVFNKSQE